MNKDEKITFLKQKLGSDRRWCLKALHRIHSNQTADEQNSGSVVEHNGMGFVDRDSEILTSIHDFYLNHGYVSDKQAVILFDKMPKYASQLLKFFCDNDKLEKIMTIGAKND